MTSTRRRVLEIAGIGGVVSLSGCVSSIVASEEDESEESSTNETEGGDSQQDAEPEDEDKSEQEEQNQQPNSEQLIQAVQFADWLSIDYAKPQGKYYKKLEEVRDKFERYNKSDPESLTTSDFEATANDLDELQEDVGDWFGEYYFVHFSFSSIASDVRTKIIPSLEREEYETAEGLIYESFRYLANEFQNLLLRYPRLIVDGGPQTRFMRAEDADSIGEENQRIFEVYYSAPKDSAAEENGKAGFFVTPGQMNIKQHPFGRDPQLETGVDGRIRPEIGSLDERSSSIFDQTEWVREEVDPVSTTHLNILDYNLIDNRYPDAYIPESDEDESDYTYKSVPNFDQKPSVKALLLEYENSETASSALDKIIDKGEQDGTIERLGLEYTKIFFNGDSTHYADITTVGNVVILTDINDTQWFNRDRSEQANANEEITATSILEGTLLDFSAEEN